MAALAKDKLAAIKDRIKQQRGTVLERVSGTTELADTDDQGQPLTGPVLVLKGIEPGSRLALSQPRPLIVLGTIGGQVSGAYKVKAGNLLGGRLEGTRHVEITHQLGSAGNADQGARIVFDMTRDPGFFSRSRHSLDKLETLAREQRPYREANARLILLRTLKPATFDIKVYISTPTVKRKPVFTVRPANKKNEVELELKDLLRYLIGQIGTRGSDLDLVERFKDALRETINESLRLSSKGGLGAALRQKRGAESYGIYAEAVYDYLVPKLLSQWHKMTGIYAQQALAGLNSAPMVLAVKGPLTPCFQVEFPHCEFHTSGTEIASKKMADCTVCGQPGEADGQMRLIYTYAGEESSSSLTKDVTCKEMTNRTITLKSGKVYLDDDATPILGPPRK